MIFLQAAQIHRHSARFAEANLNAVQRDGFFPTVSLKKLHNSKSYYWIKPDGEVVHAVYFCPLEQSFREELIMQHCLSHSVRVFKTGPLGYNILSRDQPWDFQLGLSNGDTFNFEICSISDRQGFFTRLSAEELLERHSYYPEIRLGILKKIENFFPSQEGLDLVKSYEKKGLNKGSSVANPYYPPEARVYNSLSELPQLNLLEEVKLAIKKKQAKKHLGKDRTILILDNRTSTAELSDFENLMPSLKPLLDFAEFLEIWLYTGYGGGRTKHNTDFLLLPMKLQDGLETQYLQNC